MTIKSQGRTFLINKKGVIILATKKESKAFIANRFMMS